MKRCPRCAQELPLSAFCPNRARKDGVSSYCRPCKRAKQREMTPDQRKDRNLRHVYGISLNDFRAMETKQGGACAICRRALRLCVDHCHETGAVRGLLCSPCNMGIGLLRESTRVMEGAVAYIEAHAPGVSGEGHDIGPKDFDSERSVVK